MPRKIYYTFQRERKQEQEQEEYVMIPEKETADETEEIPGFDWQPVDNTSLTVEVAIVGTVMIAMGVYQLIMTGDTSGIQQGFQTFQQVAG